LPAGSATSTSELTPPGAWWLADVASIGSVAIETKVDTVPLNAT
jgi:hypothetical protein